MPDATPAPDRPPVHDVVIAELRSILEPEPTPSDNVDGLLIVGSTRLESDLQLESLDLLRLADGLRERYGDRVDLMAYVSGLSLDEIIDLSVADVVAHVVSTADVGRSA